MNQLGPRTHAKHCRPSPAQASGITFVFSRVGLIRVGKTEDTQRATFKKERIKQNPKHRGRTCISRPVITKQVQYTTDPALSLLNRETSRLRWLSPHCRDPAPGFSPKTQISASKQTHLCGGRGRNKTLRPRQLMQPRGRETQIKPFNSTTSAEKLPFTQEEPMKPETFGPLPLR